MSDALPLPPRPNLDQYRNLARDLHRAAESTDPAAIRQWAQRWLESLARLRSDASMGDLTRETDRLVKRWRELSSHTPAEAPRLTQAQFFIARQHGFASWPTFAAHLEALTEDSSPTARFESAVDAIVQGDAATLRQLLREHPELARARSERDHRSTLLHYVSANGVEDFRQMTPANIVEITKILLKAGADVNAVSAAYGGGSTTLGLVATSIHPEQAGVQIPLLKTLLRYGAVIDGEQAGNDHSIVMGCLANGQPAAARFFADRGARLSLVEAAGVGRLDRVRMFFDDDREPLPSVTPDDLDSALLYAAGYGKADVVAFLLDHGASPDTRHGGGETPLHWVAYGPHVEVARVLLARGASVAARDHSNSTPLDWVVRGWARADDERDRERGREVAALLVSAGATPDLERFDPAVSARVRANAPMMSALGLRQA